MPTNEEKLKELQNAQRRQVFILWKLNASWHEALFPCCVRRSMFKALRELKDLEHQIAELQERMRNESQ